MKQENIPETIKKTYEYYKSGNSIPQIAKLRNLKENTIYSHIEILILNGLINLDEIIDINKKEKILEVLNKKDFEGLKPIKEQLDESISYEEIRCVLAFVKRQKEKNLNNSESDEDEELNQPLFDKLKKWCDEVAEKKRAPSFFILHWDTLKEIVNKKPKNKKELEKMNGIGKKKVESYGKEILEIINSSGENTPIFSKNTIQSEENSEFPKSDILTVKELTRYIKNILESNITLNNLFVKGEISNLRKQSSGHIYFSLKDEETQIKCILFKRANENIDFELDNGMKIIVKGRIEVYQPRGEYSIIVEEIHPDGLGALHLAFTQLKAKLEKEGLFLREHKKQIPKFPKCIGIVTSLSGAVLQDILKIIKRRYPLVKIIVIPTIVQGKESAVSIVESINLINQIPEIEVVILGRGGGSLEDLWSFNEEIVARAIFKSKIPVISAVGHETDFTISDFVADKTASTPSMAAEIVVPDVKDIYEDINNLKIRSSKSIYQKLKLYSSYLEQIRGKFIFRKPLEIVHKNYRDLDHITTQLNNLIIRVIESKKGELKNIESKIEISNPKDILKSYRFDLNVNTYRLQNNFRRIIEVRKKNIEIIESKIIALNPKAILKRGYSIVMNKNKILINSSDIKEGEDINIILHRGKIDAKVKKVH